MLRFLKILDAKRIILVIGIAVVALLVQPNHRPGGQELPVVRLISVEPSSQVLEGNRLSVTLGISPPVSAGDPGLTGGRLIGGIIVWDSWKGEGADALVAFAFHPGDQTDVVSYGVDVADDDGAINTNRTIRIEVNSVFPEYAVGSPSGATVRVLDKDSAGPPPPPPQQPPPPPEDTPIPEPPPPPPEDTPIPEPPPPPPPEDTPIPEPPPPPPPEDTPIPEPPPPPPPENTPIPEPPPPPPPEDTPIPEPPPPPPPEDTPIPEPPPPTPTLVPPPMNTPEQTPIPTAEPTLGPLSTTPQPSDTASAPELVQPGLDQPSAPVMSRAIPRVREALGGIASTPRRRITLIIIQGLASVFAAAVFARLILRRE